MFKCMPFLCNRHVDYVNKSHGNLTNVPDDVLRSARTLEELLLDFNQIKDLPKGLYRLTQLRKLTLSNNFITFISPDIGNLVNLQELNISRNEIEEIPDDIKLCKELQVLDLTGNPVQRLPDGFTRLQCLTHLGLCEAMLSRLPMDIGSLVNLETLELRENLLKHLPSSLTRLVKLRILDLGDNMLEELPDAIGQLGNLEELRLDNNELSQLPKLANLAKLAQLDLYENRLQKLPDDIGDLPSLTDLLMSRNQIESLPDTIGNLKKLIIFKADQNQLCLLPDAIGQCSSLQELILTENLLSELPATIGQLKSLTHLNADRNRLTGLPNEIGDCECLNVLSLRDNLLGGLPNTIGNLQQLHILDVSENRLHHLPIELGQCNLKAIWLSENQAQSMLNFQEDVDEMGNKVLTCFLLPQQAYHTESMENLLKGSVTTERDSQLSWAGGDHTPRTTAVRFASEEQVDNSDLENEDETSFVRHDTPHPKELRTRYNKMLRKNDVDGHVIPHNPEKRKENVSFMPAREQRDDISSDGSSIQSPSRLSNRDHQPHDGVVFSGTASPNNLVPSSSIVVPTVTVTMTSPVAEEEHKTTEQIAGDKTTDSEDVSLATEDAEVAAISAQDADDMDDGRPRRVGFALSEDFTEREGRLRRRDTPHHLKNKRITSGGLGKAESEAEKVRRILAMVAAGQHVSATSDESDRSSSIRDDSSSRRENGEDGGDDEEGVFGSEPENDEENIRLLPSTGRRRSPPPPVRFFTIDNSDSGADEPAHVAPAVEPTEPVTMDKPQVVESSVAQSAFKTISHDREEEEVVIKISRSPGVGLGISIAGGIGSTPYKGNDLGVFISRVNPGGPCDEAGIRVGDKLITVNGNNMVGIEHYQAVNVLRDAGTDITMVVTRSRGTVPTNSQKVQVLEPPSPVKLHGLNQTVVTTLRRDENGLGFNIAGGKGNVPFRPSDESVFISRIMEGSAAARDGKLRVGDQIISVNGIDVTCAHHDAVVALLTSEANEFTIVTYRENPSDEPSSGPTINHLPAPLTLDNHPPIIYRTEEAPVLRLKTSSTVVCPPALSTSPLIGFTPASSASSSSPSLPSPRSKQSQSQFVPPSPPGSPSRPHPQPAKPQSTRTVVYSIGEAAGIEPPMPVMKTFNEGGVAVPATRSASPRAVEVTPDVGLLRVRPAVASHAAPPPAAASTGGSGVNDLFSALEMSYVHSQPTSPTGRDPMSSGVGFSDSHGDKETVVLVKTNNGPLGFSIVGGIDHSCHPFGHNRPGVFISKILPNSAAARSRLRFGDRLLRVNGKDVWKVTHHEVVRYLTAPGHEVVLDVQREPPLPGIQEVEVSRRPGEKLGISIRGGTKSKSGNPLDKTDEGIFISKVMPVGAVARNGRLRVGQRILEVNGESLLGLSHQEAVHLLRCVSDRFTVVVCDGFDASLVVDGDAGSPPLRSAGSLSSIDCDPDEYARKQETSRNKASSPPTTFVSSSTKFASPPGVSSAVRSVHYDSPPFTSPSSAGTSDAGSPSSDKELLSPGSQSRSRPPVAPKTWKAPPADHHIIAPIPPPNSDVGKLRVGQVEYHPTPRSQPETVQMRRTLETAKNQPINGSGSESPLIDPLRQSRVPSARPVSSQMDTQSPKPGSVPAEREVLAFNMKKRFFEKEIENAQPRVAASDAVGRTGTVAGDDQQRLASSVASSSDVHLTLPTVSNS